MTLQNNDRKIKQEQKEQEREKTEAEETATQEDMPHQKELPPRRDTVQEERRTTRRGERQRHKLNFFGQNIMISKIEAPQ